MLMSGKAAVDENIRIKKQQNHDNQANIHNDRSAQVIALPDNQQTTAAQRRVISTIRAGSALNSKNIISAFQRQARV